MAEPSLHIRAIEERDLERIVEINEANVPEVGPIDLDRLRFLLAESVISPCVVGDDRVLGFCLVLAPGSTYDSVNYRYFMDRYEDALYLDRVAFEAAAQGRGLGRLLYGHVLDVMRSEHPAMPRLALEVNTDPPNEPSLEFHRRLGFVEVARQMSKGLEVSLMTRLVDDPTA